ncbi:MAG: hypothetical protein AAFO99_03530 [Bacteroidota bacterium]
MKLFLFLILFLVLPACTNDDDGMPQNPADALPPATRTGAQTFGCLINGEPFFPGSSGGDRPSAFYQFVRGAYTLGINASRDEGGGADFVSIGLVALDIDGLEETTYPLISEQSGNFSGIYLLGGGIVLDTGTTEENPGTLTITHFTEDIISGTFEFTVLDNQGNEIQITDGRFDLLYTN